MRFDKLPSERSAHCNMYTSKPPPTLQSVSSRNADRSRNCSVAQFLHILGHTCHPTTPSSPSRLRARVPIASSWADHGPTTGHGGPGHSACWRMHAIDSAVTARKSCAHDCQQRLVHACYDWCTSQAHTSFPRRCMRRVTYGCRASHDFDLNFGEPAKCLLELTRCLASRRPAAKL